MLTCKEAHGLIAHAVEGRIALRVFDPLRQHLSVCSSCREALDTQRRVKQALAARLPETLPAGFSARLAARLDAEAQPNPLRAPAPIVRELTLLASPPAPAAWRDSSAWRTWSLRLLPIAAALVLFMSGGRSQDEGQDGRRLPPSGTSASVGSNELEWLARPNTMLDSLLVMMAKGPAPTPVLSSPAGVAAPSPVNRAESALSAGSAQSDGQGNAQPSGDQRPIGVNARRTGSEQAPIAAGPIPPGPIPPGPIAAGPIATGAASAASALTNAWPAPAPVAAVAGGLPGTVVPNAVPTALAGQIAQELRLTDAQRKQIEAIYDAQRQKLSEILESNRQRLTLERRETDEAVEKVLTPRQRQRYRDMNAQRGPALPASDTTLPPATLPNGLEITVTTTPPPPFR